jgi:hypothetical protein
MHQTTYAIFEPIYPITPSTKGIKAKIFFFLGMAKDRRCYRITTITCHRIEERENHDSHYRKVKKGKNKEGIYFSKRELFNLKLLSRWVTRLVK